MPSRIRSRVRRRNHRALDPVARQERVRRRGDVEAVAEQQRAGSGHLGERAEDRAGPLPDRRGVTRHTGGAGASDEEGTAPTPSVPAEPNSYAGFVAVSADVIDCINILEATRLAMCQAASSLQPAADCLVVDAVTLSGFRVPCLPLIRGDAVSYGVACASILAKVERDRLMTDYHREYPQYGFAAHKGYSVPEHLQALETYGPCPIHRLTYRPVLPREARG